jgi:DUF1365 family protein
MRSAIVRGTVFHCRMEPRRHEFSYPVVALELDIDELERNQLNSLLFGYERDRLLSIRVSDYLREPEPDCQPISMENSGRLRKRIESEILRQGGVESPARITLVTMPRLCGYIFNPVSFFLCFDSQDKLIACITEVHNTFGEAHIYPLVCQPSSLPVEWRFPKSFYVSPFFDTTGEYRVVVGSEGQKLDIKVDLFKAGEMVFGSSLTGAAKGLSSANLLKTLIRFPFTLLLTMPRIHLQALILFARTKVTPFLKPTPASPYTIRSQQNSIHKARLWLLLKMRQLRKTKDQYE